MLDTASAPARNNQSPGADKKYLSVEKLRKQYNNYLNVKRPEIDEAKTARHYYHGDHWTAEEIKALKDRKQPVTTDNRISRKIDAVVGLLERLKQDPKAYPRTPKHEDGADVATAVLRYVLDNNDWSTISPQVARHGAIEGVGGIEINIVGGAEGDTENDGGDPDVELSIVDPDTFFYDPRSFRADFSDARYMGIAKWLDVEMAKEMLPEHADVFEGMHESGSDFGADADRERKWFDTNDGRIRLIDHWYVRNGQWCWALYIRDQVLREGHSFLIDEDNKSWPRFVMFSGAVDHDGDRYGFVRNLKSPQDEINKRRSKALHLASSRRIVAEQGAFDDIERARKEAARPDGVVLRNKGFEAEFEDAKSQADMAAQLKFLEQSITVIENFGPNPALIGQGIENSSGRAISLLQQAGIAELGPYMISYRGWKIRVYRACWWLVQRYWKSERWVRVTDDEGVAQFLQLNGVDMDQMGRPALVNQLGELDVDIILDEGPDTLTMQADTYEGLQALGPSFASEFPDIAIKLLPGIQGSVRKEILDRLKQKAQQPPPEVAAQQQKLQLDQQNAQAQMAMDRQRSEHDAQLSQFRIASEIQLKRETAAADIQLEREHNAAQLELQRQKDLAQLALDRDKSNMQLASKAREAQLDLDLRTRVADHEAQQRTAERKERAQTQADGNDGIGKALTHIGTLIQKTGESTQKAVTAPRKVKVVRGKDGKMAGAEIG